MPIPTDLILENERVLLRPLIHSDYQLLLPFALQEPDTWKYSIVSAAGEEGMMNYVQTAVKGREDGHSFPFIVFDKQAQACAGSTRFYDILPANQSLQLGYTWYGKQFQRTGLNRNCKYLLLQYAFETLNMERVEFRADNNNQRSIDALKAIGCVPEGVLRSHMPLPDGSRRDSIVLSILKKEWTLDIKERLEKMIYR